MTDEELQQVLDLLEKADGYSLEVMDGPVIIHIEKRVGDAELPKDPYSKMGPEAN